MEPTEGSAADATALPGTQNKFHGDVFDPALAELPRLGDPFGNRGGPFARRAENAPQGIIDGIREHRTERLVGAGELGDLTAQCGEVGFGGAVDGAEVQL